MDEELIFMFMFGLIFLGNGLWMFGEAKNNPKKLLKRYYTYLAQDLLGKELTIDIYKGVGIISILFGIIFILSAIVMFITDIYILLFG